MAKSASAYGTFRKRTIDEFLGMNLLLMGLRYITKDKEGKDLAEKSYYMVSACINDTGEMVEFASSQTYLSKFYAKAAKENEFPVEFCITKPGKSYEISDWEE